MGSIDTLIHKIRNMWYPQLEKECHDAAQHFLGNPPWDPDELQKRFDVAHTRENGEPIEEYKFDGKLAFDIKMNIKFDKYTLTINRYYEKEQDKCSSDSYDS